MSPIPAEIRGQRYISLATFRKSGVAVYTPIWFAEDDTKLYFMTNSKLGVQAHPQQPASQDRALHHPRENYRPGIPGYGSRNATRRVRSRPPVDQCKILAGSTPIRVAQHRHLH
jgi:hypothetical protein